ncbi:MAG: benzoate MFS transporter BenK, partial [uncultured Actinomycetospora sp.]
DDQPELRDLRPRRGRRLGPPAVLGGRGPGGLRPRGPRRRAGGAAARPGLGPRPRRRLRGGHRRPAGRHGRRTGRRSRRRRHRPPGDDARDRHGLLGADAGLRLRPEPRSARGAALPRGPRARRGAARRARARRRVRAAGARQQLDHDPHDRLPRRRGGDGPARHPAHQPVRVAGDVRGRRAPGGDPAAAAVGAAAGVGGVPGAARARLELAQRTPRAAQPPQDLVPRRPRPPDDRLLDRVVHGPAAGLRPQHLAPGDHALGRLRARGGARAAARAQRRGHPRPAARRHRRQPHRRAPGDDRLVRGRDALPGAALDPPTRDRGVRQRPARGDLRVLRAGAGVRLRLAALPRRGSGHGAGHGQRRRAPGRHHRPDRRRRPAPGRDRLPLGLLRLRRRRRPGRRRRRDRGPGARSHV